MRIATFYRPVTSSQGRGPGSLYLQHLTYFNSTKRRICQRQRLLNELKEEVDKCKKEGDLILLMGEFNEYILSHRSRQYFSKLGLREIITDKHGYEGPGSNRSNKKNNAIDGIWGSPGLATTSCGYLTVNYGLKSDHRLILVKISLANALVEKTIPSKTPSSCKLCLHHLVGQQKNISKIRHIPRQHIPLTRIISIENHQKFPPSPEAIKYYEETDKLLIKAI